MKDHEVKSNKNQLDICPHCGKMLSPWQRVLLNVDRAVMCKNCWYRIILSKNESTDAEVKNKSKSEE